MHEFTHKDFLKCVENESIRKFVIEEVKKYVEKSEKEKTELDKKHDKIFKNILSDKKEAVNFINRIFKLNLKPDGIEAYDKEFIKKGGRILEADIIYKVKGKNIFFLIEHQTKNDYRMPFKILNYEIEIMRTCDVNDKVDKEGTVLAAVIHTGHDNWNAATSIREIQEDVYNKGKAVLGDIQTLGNYILEDIKNYTKNELLKSDGLLYKAMYLEKSNNTDEFIRASKEVFKVITNEEQEKMCDIIRIGLSGKIVNKEIEKFIRDLKGGVVNMLAVKEVIDAEFESYKKQGIKEGIKKGVKKGRKIGIETGRNEEKCKIAKKLLSMGYNTNNILEITGLSKEEIIKIKNKK